MQIPSRRVLIASAVFVLFSFLAIASTMISAVRNHLRSKIFPYLQAPFTSTTTPHFSPNMSALSTFLADNKKAFLTDVTSNQGEGWTIVMGNEAGDLDSCASAIGYSYLSTTLDNTRTIALIQTPREDLTLRAENLLAFKYAHLDSDQSDLLMLDDIPSSVPLSSLRTSFALVDHNRLAPKFASGDDRVTAIFDHHDDEGQHMQANPRIVRVPTGSCASLLADYFRPRFPPSNDAILDVASLLVSAIVIDTGGLKLGGKAQPVDYSAYEFLYPLSRFGTISTTSAESAAERKTTSELNDILSKAKQAVSDMPGRDLLRRDYKEYEFGSVADGNFTRIGLSTVPMGLDDWIERGDPATFWADQTQWIAERNLTFSGVLTTFRTKHKQKHKREMLLVFPAPAGEQVGDAPSGLEKKMYDGIEANAELDAERRDLPGIEGRRARAWEQKNKNATRKTIAPVIKAIIQGN